MLKNIYNKKSFRVLLGILYSYLFYFGYKNFLHEAYLYAGYDIRPERITDSFFLLCTFLLSVFPLFFHNGVKKISSFLCIFVYLILYVPVVFTFFFQREGTVEYIMYIQALFCIGMCMLIMVDRIPVSRNFYLPLSLDMLKIVLVLTWIGTLYIGYIYRGSLNFSSYEDVYIQRSATAALGSDVITAYFGAWLANVLIPICSAYGLFSGKKIYFITGALGALIFYMATADKAILLFPYIILAMYFLLRNKQLKNSFSDITIGFSTIMVITLVTGFSIISALFWMRTIGNGGLLTSLYHEYFARHPITYYSHINFVNALANSYPYGDKSLGQVIGSQYFSNDTNANANFWATDGIASLGNLGIIFSSLMLSFVFYLFNKVSVGYHKLFIVCILIPYISSLLNQSLFSSMFTGGALLIMLILSFKSMVKNPYINENINNSGSTPAVR